MAPPPPTLRFQLKNLVPVTERTPWAVCHLRLSWGSGWAPVAWSTAVKGRTRSWSAFLRVSAKFIVGSQGGTQALAVFHVEDVAGLGEAVDEGGGEVVVLEEGPPFAEAQIGGDEGGLFLVPLLHEGEKEADLNRFDLNVSDFVDQQNFVGKVLAQDLLFGVIGDGLEELGDQFGEEDVAAAVALVDGVNQKAGGQAGLAAAGAAQPDDVLVVGQETLGVVESHDLFLVELGLLFKRVGFDNQPLGEAGLGQAELACVLPLEFALFGHDVFQEPAVGKILLRGQLEIVIPVGEQSS